jgi:hypothetical protein
MSELMDSEGLAEGAADEDMPVEPEPESDEPQAASDRGSARARAATVIRVERMGTAP